MIILFRNTTGVEPREPFVPKGSFIGYGVEPSYNSLVSPDVYIPASGFSFSDNRDIVAVNKLRRDLTPDTYILDNLGYDGSLESLLVTSGMGGMIRSLLGCERPEGASTQNGRSLYVFEPDYLYGPSLSFVVNTDTSIDDGLVLRRSGGVISGMELNGTFGEIVNTNWTVIGVETQLGIISDFSPVWQDELPLHFSDTSISINDVQADDIQSFRLVITSEFSEKRLIRRNTKPTLQVRSGFSVDLEIQASLETDTYWSSLKEDEEVKVSLDIDNGLDSFIVSLPRMIIQSSDISVQAETTANTQSLTLKGLGGTASPVAISIESSRF